MAPARVSSAGDIAKRYGLPELVRARVIARRLALNALARTASTSMQGSLELIYPNLVPLNELDLLTSRDYLLPEDAAAAAAVPRTAYDTRLYNRRLAEMEAIRMDAVDRADDLLDRYLTRSRARAAITQSSAHAEEEGEEEPSERDDQNLESATVNHTGEGEGGKTKSKGKTRPEQLVEEEIEENVLGDLLEEEYENRYLDLISSSPYESPVWRRAGRRLLRHRFYPHRLRALPLTRRAMERRAAQLVISRRLTLCNYVSLVFYKKKKRHA